MKVILLKKNRNLGEIGDIVEVKAGYGRNYLIPYGEAVLATQENIAKIEVQRAELEKAAAEVLAAAQERAKQFEQLENITIVRKTLEGGRLFGSVGISDLVNALAERNITVEKREINLPSGPIREVGEYDIEVHLHSDVIVTVKMIVKSEEEVYAEEVTE
jgi:large subunit ribosomal protein L9